MNWQNKIYENLVETENPENPDSDDRHSTISALAKEIKSMKPGEARSAKILQVQKLITGGRQAGRGAIETAPRRRRNLRDTSR